MCRLTSTKRTRPAHRTTPDDPCPPPPHPPPPPPPLPRRLHPSFLRSSSVLLLQAAPLTPLLPSDWLLIGSGVEGRCLIGCFGVGRGFTGTGGGGGGMKRGVVCWFLLCKGYSLHCLLCNLLCFCVFLRSICYMTFNVRSCLQYKGIC